MAGLRYENQKRRKDSIRIRGNLKGKKMAEVMEQKQNVLLEVKNVSRKNDGVL